MDANGKPAQAAVVQRYGRRVFLAKLGAAVVAAFGWHIRHASTRGSSTMGSTRTWSGRVRLNSFTIEAGRRQRFNPNRSTTVILTGNLVVKGVLEMRPANPGVVHTLIFKGINESKVRGGGMKVLRSDVGLWVMNRGQLDLQGTPRAGWNRTGTHETWRPRDELRRAPHQAGDFLNFPRHTPGSPVPRAYPEVPPTEVCNLTRNVVIRGMRKGRAHIFIRSTKRQSIRHALIRYMGPGAVGRYPLHFHHCRNGSRGSLVEGVVLRECRDRGFVPHASHGITFRDCIAYNMRNAPYWWDPPAKNAGAHCREVSPRDECNQTHDTLYEHCLAARIGPNSQGRSGQNGFTLVAGVRNACVDCVVVGNGGRTPAGAFHWPSTVNHDPNVWRFEDCVAHNNKVNGIYVWQNDSNPHVIERFTAYHNGKAGIEQGAYANPYHYRNSVLVANRDVQLIQHSNSRSNKVVGRGAGYTRVRFHAKGRTRRAHILSLKHSIATTRPVEWTECGFDGEIPVLDVDERSGSSKGFPADLHFVRCLVNGRDMEPTDVVITLNENGTVVRGQRRDGSEWQISGSGAVSSIPPLWTG